MTTNYYKRTLDELFTEIGDIAEKNSPDKNWSGLTYGGIPWILGKTLAEVTQLILYNQDMRANESYIDTASLRASLRKIADLFGYTVTERTGATTTLSFTATNDVTVPKGTKVASSNGEVFCTKADLVLSSAGSLTGTVSAVHSGYAQITKTAVGEQAEEVALNYDNILVGQVIVTVNGTTYTKVANFSSSDSTDTHYRLVFNDDETVRVIFGDGVYGKRLTADDSIVVDVYYGGGIVGNDISIGDITTLKSVFTGSNYISSVSNTTATSGGGIGSDIDVIRKEIQSYNTYRSGIISSDKAADIVTANLDWAADAITDSTWTSVSGLTIPTTTVYAFPIDSTVVDMSGAQSSALSSFLATRGEVGVDWQVDNAVSAPVEIEVDVNVETRSLENQTETKIKNALNTDTDALFSFNQLSFDQNILLNEVSEDIDAVDNVLWNRITRLARVPQTMVITGAVTDDDWAADLELGSNAEDGYFEFTSTSTTAATSKFHLPVTVSSVGTSQVVSLSSNWKKQQFTYSLGSSLDDSGDDYVKEDTKLKFKQSTRVWSTNAWAGSAWNGKYLLYVSWVDDNNETQQAWYSIASNTSTEITSTEDASSPISGTAITTLANAAYSQISVAIVRDLSEGTLVGANNNTYTITHNTANTIYTSESTINLPVDKYSHVRFDETALDLSSNTYASASDILRIRIDTSEAFAAADKVVRVYTTPVVSRQLKYKSFSEVFTLADTNITVNFV